MVSFNKKNEFYHNSIDHLPVKKIEPDKIDLLKIAYFSLIALGIVGAYLYHSYKSNPTKNSEAVISTATISPSIGSLESDLRKNYIK